MKKKKKEKSCSNGFCVKFDLAICIFSANKVKNLFMKRKAFVTNGSILSVFIIFDVAVKYVSKAEGR